MITEAKVSAEDKRFAEDWNAECRHCSEYDGDFQADFEQAVAQFRLTALADAERKLEEARGLAQAYVLAWEAGTGTVYLIDQFRASLAAQDGGKAG